MFLGTTDIFFIEQPTYSRRQAGPRRSRNIKKPRCRKYVGNAVAAEELLGGEHDPLLAGSYILWYRDLLSICRLLCSGRHACVLAQPIYNGRQTEIDSKAIVLALVCGSWSSCTRFLRSEAHR